MVTASSARALRRATPAASPTATAITPIAPRRTIRRGPQDGGRRSVASPAGARGPPPARRSMSPPGPVPAHDGCAPPGPAGATGRGAAAAGARGVGARGRCGRRWRRGGGCRWAGGAGCGPGKRGWPPGGGGRGRRGGRRPDAVHPLAARAGPGAGRDGGVVVGPRGGPRGQRGGRAGARGRGRRGPGRARVGRVVTVPAGAGGGRAHPARRGRDRARGAGIVGDVLRRRHRSQVGVQRRRHQVRQVGGPGARGRVSPSYRQRSRGGRSPGGGSPSVRPFSVSRGVLVM